MMQASEPPQIDPTRSGGWEQKIKLKTEPQEVASVRTPPVRSDTKLEGGNQFYVCLKNLSRSMSKKKKNSPQRIDVPKYTYAAGICSQTVETKGTKITKAKLPE